MRKIKFYVITFSVLWFFACFSCNMLDLTDNEMNSNEISLNLSKNGEYEPSLLIGEWSLNKFAYTADGNKITILADDLASYDILGKPHFSRLNILDYTNELGVPVWFFSYVSQFRVEYSITPPNHIQLSLYQISYDLPNSPKQEAIVSSLNNAQSFVIKGDELMIYFTGDKDKNLLIFKN